MNPAEPGPGGRERRVLLQALEVQVTREAPLLGVVTELVAAQEELIRLGAGGDITAELPPLGRRERQRQRRHDALCQVVLDREDVANRRLCRVGPEERTGRSVRELARDANRVAGTQECP